MFKRVSAFKSIASMIGLPKATLSTIINEHKFLLKEIKRKECQQRLSFKITSEHLLHVQKYLDQNSTKLMSIHTLRDHLRQVRHLQVHSRSDVYLLLTKILKYSFKQAHKIPKKNVEIQED